jgi:hypothetical protein
MSFLGPVERDIQGIIPELYGYCLVRHCFSMAWPIALSLCMTQGTIAIFLNFLVKKSGMALDEENLSKRARRFGL